MPTAIANVRHFRWSLSHVLLLPLFVAPAFLGPVYYDTTEHRNPYLMMFAVLIAPAGYVALFSYRVAARTLGQESDAKRPSVVFAALRSGMKFGAVFGAMVICSFGVLSIRALIPFDWTWQQLLMESIEVAMAALIALFHYFVIGAATGGVVGLAVDSLGRRSQSVISPKP